MEEPRTIVWIGIIWTWGSAVNTFLMATIFFVFGEPVGGWIAVALATTYIICWLIFTLTGSVRATFTLAIGASMVAVALLQIAMGGYAYSGAQPVWAIGVTVVAALLLSRGTAVGVAVYWLIAVITFAVVEQTLQSSRLPPDPSLSAVFFAYNIVAHLLLMVPVVGYLLSRLTAERERSESLLLNVLPESVAARLKATPGVIADDFTVCTVLFADISGFTSHTRQIPPQQLIKELNAVFSTFDGLADHHGVQKIKTTGDGYMAVAGIPLPKEHHLEAVLELALEMQTAMERIAEELDADLHVRIGINTGPAVAGIIGTSRFSYDIWGETVNLASRLESYGEPGKVQVSRAVVEKAGDGYRFEPAGPIDLKGIGTVETFWLMGRK